MPISGPGDISGLVLDLDPHEASYQDTGGTTPAGAGDSVARVDDQSATGANVTQATAANQPLLQADANGWLYLDCDGTDDILSESTFDAGSQPFTVAVVAHPDVSAGVGFVRRQDNANSGIYLSLSRWAIRFDTQLREGTGTGTTDRAVVIGLANGASSTLHVDGTQKLSGDAGASAWGTGIDIGNGGGFFLDGRLYRVLIYNKALSSTERTDLNDYLTTLYSNAPPGGGSTHTVSVSDNLGLDDDVSRSATLFRSATDNLGLQDPGLLKPDYRRLTGENLGFSDSVSRAVTALRAIADNLGLTDDVATASEGPEAETHNIQVTDSLGLSDAVQRAATAFRRAIDNLGLSDTVSRKSDARRSISDRLGLSDAVSRSVTALRSISDSLGLSDDAQRSVTALRSIQDFLGLSDSMLVDSGELLPLFPADTDIASTGLAYTTIARSVPADTGISRSGPSQTSIGRRTE